LIISYYFVLFCFTVTISSRGKHKIEIEFEMCCTANVMTNISVVRDGKGYVIIPFVAESMESGYISVDEIKLGKVIGKGSYAFFFIKKNSLNLEISFFFFRFGQVFLGKYRGETVAVKQLNISHRCLESEVEHEVKMMSQFTSPHVVYFYGTMAFFFFLKLFFPIMIFFFFFYREQERTYILF